MRKTRDKLRALLAYDPYGEMSDYALSAQLGVSEATVQYHRARLGVPSARERRRMDPAARTVSCEPCGRTYLLAEDRRRRTCSGCGQTLRFSDTP